jgi:hypothetical protein
VALPGEFLEYLTEWTWQGIVLVLRDAGITLDPGKPFFPVAP